MLTRFVAMVCRAPYGLPRVQHMAWQPPRAERCTLRCGGRLAFCRATTRSFAQPGSVLAPSQRQPTHSSSSVTPTENTSAACSPGADADRPIRSFIVLIRTLIAVISTVIAVIRTLIAVMSTRKRSTLAETMRTLSGIITLRLWRLGARLERCAPADSTASWRFDIEPAWTNRSSPAPTSSRCDCRCRSC